MVVSLDFLLNRYKVVKSTIGEWAKKFPEMKVGRNQYDLAACDLVFINKLQEEIEKLSSTPENLSPENPVQRKLLAECRWIEAKAGREEIQLNKDRGLLIDFKEVEEDLSEALEAIKAQFTALPGICSVKLSGMDNVREIEGYLTKLVDERLTELESSFDAIANTVTVSGTRVDDD